MNQQQLKKLYKERKVFLRTQLTQQKITISEFENSLKNYRLFLEEIKHIKL